MKAFRVICTFQRLVIVAAAVIALFPTLSAGADSGAPGTTYSALTAKNTSAGFGTNVEITTGTPSENVSKTSLASLLPAGSSPRIYAHFLAWFGSANHEDVGYSSADATQVHNQVADMLSRGINGVIVNWQGRSDFTNQAASLIMAEAESQGGAFEFSIEEDANALAGCAATTGCDMAAQVESDLRYIQSTYASANSYTKFEGHPVIFLYGMEAYKLNWDTIRASLTGNPVLIFRAAPGTVSAAITNPLSMLPQRQVAFSRCSVPTQPNRFDREIHHA